jgi:hypothetical protein
LPVPLDLAEHQLVLLVGLPLCRGDLGRTDLLVGEVRA